MTAARPRTTTSTAIMDEGRIVQGTTWLPSRPGPRPRTSTGIPHRQLDQQPASPAIREQLAAWAFSLPLVREAPSGISVPGARAMVLDRAAATGPPEAFLTGREFAHLHPGDDYSLHACLPEPVAQAACRAAWAEPHPLAASGNLPATVVMLYAPRNAAELRVVTGLLSAARRFAMASPARRT